MGIFDAFGDDEADREKLKLMVLIIAVLLFIVSVFMSWRELRYFKSGVQADGTVANVWVETRTIHHRHASNTSYRQRVASYTFDDGGVPRSEHVDVAMNWPHRVGDKLKVQYIPGEKNYVRLYGTWQWWWLLFFAATSAFVLYHIMSLLREARAFAREQAAYDADAASHRGELVKKPSKIRH